MSTCPENQQPCDSGCTGGWCRTLFGTEPSLAQSERGITQDQRAAAAVSSHKDTDEAGGAVNPQTAAHPLPTPSVDFTPTARDLKQWLPFADGTRFIATVDMLERENAELRAVNAVVSNGLRDEIAELRAQLAEAQAELTTAYAAIDANWVTHQRVVEAERQRDEARKGAERYLDAIFQMADDGWLMHGEEGMDDTQEVVYAIAQEHPEYKRRVADAAKEKTNG